MDTMEDLLGGMLDKDVKIGNRVSRSSTKPWRPNRATVPSAGG